jgi:hypothetical protein
MHAALGGRPAPLVPGTKIRSTPGHVYRCGHVRTCSSAGCSGKRRDRSHDGSADGGSYPSLAALQGRQREAALTEVRRLTTVLPPRFKVAFRTDVYICTRSWTKGTAPYSVGRETA